MSHPNCDHVRYRYEPFAAGRLRKDQGGEYVDRHHKLRRQTRETLKVVQAMWRRPSPNVDTTPQSRADKTLFNALADQWLADTGHVSSVPRIVMHPAYQQIMAMGKSALPLILRAMAEKPGYWFWALEMITRENPVPAESAGRVRQMKQAWLDWGADRGLI